MIGYILNWYNRYKQKRIDNKIEKLKLQCAEYKTQMDLYYGKAKHANWCKIDAEFLDRKQHYRDLENHYYNIAKDYHTKYNTCVSTHKKLLKQRRLK